ncbi:hypothetical protein IPP75_04860 [Candidatus Saccharibacteria bacterium]|nr:MAG: hypothetical protein IPP75_04860 [Candidatus Saccharibacteria bacterium]
MALDECKDKPPLDEWANDSVAAFQEMVSGGHLIGAQQLRAVTMAEAERYVKDGHTPKEVEEALVTASATLGISAVERFLGSN